MRARVVALTALVITAALAAAPVAFAAPAPHPIFSNYGDGAPSLSLSVSPGGEPEVASVGLDGSLWFTCHVGTKWHRTKVAGAGTAFSGPSLVAGPSGVAFMAVEGASHTLQYYFLRSGLWHHVQVAGKDTAYSAPSLAEGPSGLGIAIAGPGNSLRYYHRLVSGKWLMRVINGAGTTFSAPSLVIRSSSQARTGDPAGEVDIAVENGNHTLSYYNSLANGNFQNDVIGGLNSTYSAPSLIVIASAGRTSRVVGVPVIMVEGASHTLQQYQDINNWQLSNPPPEGRNWVYSAPSLLQGGGSIELPVAFQGASHSLAITFLHVVSRSVFRQNDPVAFAFTTYSAPAMFYRTASPAGELDIAVQGSGNTLRYYHAPAPASGLAPNFTGMTIAGPGTTAGG